MLQYIVTLHPSVIKQDLMHHTSKDDKEQINNNKFKKNDGTCFFQTQYLHYLQKSKSQNVFLALRRLILFSPHALIDGSLTIVLLALVFILDLQHQLLFCSFVLLLI